jgi:Spy/CpxP family protein refolding chaperone
VFNGEETMKRVTTQAFWGTAFVVGMIVIALAVSLSAQPPAGGQGQRGQWMGQGMRGGMRGGPMAALNLTQDQRDAIQKIMTELRDQHQPQMDQLRQAQTAMRDAIFGATPDAGKAKAAAQTISEIDAAMMQSRIDAQIQVANILTPDQRKTVLSSGMDFPPMGPGGMRGPGRGQAPPRK